MQPASFLSSSPALQLLTSAFPRLGALVARHTPSSYKVEPQIPATCVGFRGGGGVEGLSCPRQHPPSPSPFKPIATLLAASTKELLLGAPLFAFKVHERKMEPSSWQDGLVPYVKTS